MESSQGGSKTAPQAFQDIPEGQIAALLEIRFGDGMVYLPKKLPIGLVELAVKCGFMDASGLLTRRGRALMARYHFA